MLAKYAAVAAALAVQSASAATVFAHFMVANSYAYNAAQWKADITAAQQIGIDGFALNWTPPDCISDMEWTVTQIENAYTAASSMGFKLMHSFDMSWSECDTYWNTTFMQTMLVKSAASSAAFRWNSNLLVSTYGGDQVSQYGNSFFQTLKTNMKTAGYPISLSPALTTYAMGAQYQASQYASSLTSDYSSIDGYLNWQAWPLESGNNMTTTADAAFQAALKSAGRTGPYIMAVSPWQYKDLNDGNTEDSWVAYSDTLFVQRFQSLVNKEVQPDIIELLTWNDYAESHYLRQLPSQDVTATDYVVMGDEGNYVYGQNHNPWRVIAKYYITWWKNGKAPSVTMDQVVFWHRNHPKGISCTGGSVRGSTYPVDGVFSWALVSAKSTISVAVGSNKYTYVADQTGPVLNMVPFPSNLSSGITPAVSIIRGGKVLQSASSGQAITSACSYQNYNPVVTLAGQGVNK